MPLAGLPIASNQLNNNKLTNLNPLSSIRGLVNLRIAGNGIKDIAALSTLSNLTLLEIANNQIEDISPLKGLTKIGCLYLSKNKIHDLTPFTGSFFRVLDLRDNQINDVSPLATMPKLQSLLLSKNQITDIEPVAQIRTLEMADVSANPLNEKSKPVINSMQKGGTIVKSGDVFYQNCSFDCIPLWINGTEQVVKNKFYTQDGRVMIALREIFELLGASVSWDENTYKITASKGEKRVSIQIGSKDAEVNGSKAILDVAPYLIGEVTYVPVRFVSEALGAQVIWDEMSQSVSITTN
ncbi:stalk domain-containing protein [Paenibacillus anseongense]|uniref:stalk domain-containing protein n=1 Tax=Paenibacillus anseongense TaxID=2682845 RepID=UPI002DB84558|nr:stalk domain-containing protein [Paenibacillus anseongense]